MCDAFGVPIRVMYLDSNVHGAGGGGMEANSHDFTPQQAPAGGGSSAKVHILYRPGHYDILYPL